MHYFDCDSSALTFLTMPKDKGIDSDIKKRTRSPYVKTEIKNLI